MKCIICEKEGPVCKVTLNRPEALNAINMELAAELRQTFEQMRGDNNIKVVILTGAGRAFSAGRDLKEYRGYGSTPAEDWERRQGGWLFSGAMEGFGKPIIAAVNGFALAGGCELALACDIRIASEDAKFGLPEINLGVFPGAGATYLLPRFIGRSRTLELVFTGDTIDALEAERIGLVNRVVPRNKLESTVNEIANKIASKRLLALKLAKAAIIQAEGKSLKDARDATYALRALAESTQDVKKGIEAVLEKKIAKFDD